MLELNRTERESVARVLACLDVETAANANNQMSSIWDCLAGGLRERCYATPPAAITAPNVIALRPVRGQA